LTINHQLNLREKKILLLGAGGAARGVIAPLLAEQPACVTIANRTAHKATTLAQLFSGLGPIEASDLNNLNGSFNLVINATSASLHGCIPGLSPLVVKNTFCYDMVYAAAATPFLRWAKEQGAADCTDGLGMLVEQAAEAFYVWRGVRWSRSLK
jgi:shikimate dehydrogenase